MKIERRANSVFVAHNNMAIFTNKFFDTKTNKQAVSIRINKRLETGKWVSIGEMQLSLEEYQQWTAMLGKHAEKTA